MGRVRRIIANNNGLHPGSSGIVKFFKMLLQHTVLTCICDTVHLIIKNHILSLEEYSGPSGSPMGSCRGGLKGSCLPDRFLP